MGKRSGRAVWCTSNGRGDSGSTGLGFCGDHHEALRGRYSIFERYQTAGRFDRSYYQTALNGEHLDAEGRSTIRRHEVVPNGSSFRSWFRIPSRQCSGPGSARIPDHPQTLDCGYAEYSYFTGDLILDGALPLTG